MSPRSLLSGRAQPGAGSRRPVRTGASSGRTPSRAGHAPCRVRRLSIGGQPVVGDMRSSPTELPVAAARPGD
jgi:hypothetical protein